LRIRKSLLLKNAQPSRASATQTIIATEATPMTSQRGLRILPSVQRRLWYIFLL